MQSSPSGGAGLLDDIARWRAGVGARAPAYHAVFAALVEELADPALAARFDEVWSARDFHAFYERPLLLMASLRFDALVEGPGHPLFAALGPSPDPGAVDRAAVRAALERDSAWRSMRDRFVQTNETTRAVTWLWPAASFAARPLGLLEVGAAAGLNLVADRLPRPWVDGAGAALPTAGPLETFARVGVDMAPLDVTTDEGADWLRACVWAGEEARLSRLEAAIAAFRRAPAEVVAGDLTEAPARLAALSEAAPDDGVVIAFQTIMRDYVPPDAWSRYDAAMRAWLDDEPPGRALWLELEIDHADPGLGVPIIAHAKEGARVVDIELARTGFHPSTIEVDAAGPARLAALFA